MSPNPSAYRPPKPPQPEQLSASGELPPGSRLFYPRNAIFTGRTTDLLAIAKVLLNNSLQKSSNTNSALTGVILTQGKSADDEPGGSGKTQLAVEFCYRYGRYFQGVHWIQADQEIVDELAACGTAMRLSALPQKTFERAQATLLSWKRTGLHLVVLDHAEKENDIFEWLEKMPTARVLVTSSRPDWMAKTGFYLYPLDILSHEDSRKLLKTHAQHLNKWKKVDFLPILERLGGLPQAVDLAGRYLAVRPELSSNGYLAELTLADEILKRTTTTERNEESPSIPRLAAIYAVNWKQLKTREQNPLIWECFHACGYFAPNVPIPYDILAKSMGHEMDDDFKEAVTRLFTLGFLQVIEAGVVIHPRLNEFSRWMQQQGGEQDMLPRISEGLLSLARQANESNQPEEIESLWPHVRAAAEAAETAKLEHSGSIWNSLGYHLWSMTEYSGAQVCFEKALGLLEAIFGREHANIAAVKNNLGEVLYAQDEFAEARTCFEQALHIWRKTNGEEHANVATAYNNLGNTMKEIGDLTAAQVHYEKAVLIWRKTLGRQHPKLAATLLNLGEVLYKLGEKSAAQACFAQTFEVDEVVYGFDHPQRADRFNEIASILRNGNNPAGAAALYEQALRIFERVYGAEHAKIASTLNDLGEMLYQQDKIEEAKSCFRRAVKIGNEIFGAVHPYIATITNNLGSSQWMSGDLRGAQVSFERALEIDEAVYGIEHLSVARDANNLGSTLQAQGKPEEAKAYFKRALQIREHLLPPDHPKIIAIKQKLNKI